MSDRDSLCTDGKHRYQQTEVGLIPADWEALPCAAVAERIVVGIVIRPAQYYVRHGVPAFRSANVREDGIDDRDLVFISDRSNALLSKSQVRPGDIVTVRTGYPGTSAVVPPAFAGANCIDILITRPSKRIVSEYLAAWINSPFGKAQVLRNQGGMAQQHFNVGDMRNLVVALPALPEQRAIAAALGDVDALIGALDRLIAKKRDLKQAAMQQLLTGQTRLPGFGGEWETRRLGTVAGFRTGPFGSALHKSDYTNDGIPIVNPMHIIEGLIVPTTTMTITEHAAEKLADFRLKRSEVIIGRRGDMGRCAVVQAPQAGWLCGTGSMIVRPSSRLSPHFLQRLLSSPPVIAAIEDSSVGTTMVNLNQGVLAGLQMNLPSYEEQVAIAGVLADMDLDLTALEQRRDKAHQLKQGMMQELLTGRIRLV